MPAIRAKPLEERTAWGLTPFDQLLCRISFRRHRYDGDFTPIGLQPALQNPGNLGGMNWGGVSVDPANLYAYVVDIRMPVSFQLIPGADAVPADFVSETADSANAMKGTPYRARIEPWVSPIGAPCSEPPFGTVTAIDLKTRRIAWQVPAGTSPGGKLPLPLALGMPAYAGATATAGGLLFFAGLPDDRIRAYDAETGNELWSHRLPTGASATPMTYVSPKTGRQYVVLSVGGGPRERTPGDFVVAFALPAKT